MHVIEYVLVDNTIKLTLSLDGFTLKMEVPGDTPLEGVLNKIGVAKRIHYAARPIPSAPELLAAYGVKPVIRPTPKANQGEIEPKPVVSAQFRRQCRLETRMDFIYFLRNRFGDQSVPTHRRELPQVVPRDDLLRAINDWVS